MVQYRTDTSATDTTRLTLLEKLASWHLVQYSLIRTHRVDVDIVKYTVHHAFPALVSAGPAFSLSASRWLIVLQQKSVIFFYFRHPQLIFLFGYRSINPCGHLISSGNSNLTQQREFHEFLSDCAVNTPCIIRICVCTFAIINPIDKIKFLL